MVRYYSGMSDGCGFILCIEKVTNRPVGIVQATVNANSTGWVAMFIVDKAHRGKGMGRELFKAMLADFDRCGTRNRGLDAVIEQVGTYQRGGFEVSPVDMAQMAMRGLVAGTPLPESAKSALSSDGTFVDLKDVSKELLAAHESRITGWHRPKLWSNEALFNWPDAWGWMLANETVPKDVKDVRAWTMIRHSSGGYRIGPVYAQNAEDARAVLVQAMTSATSNSIKAVPLPGEPISDLLANEIDAKGTLVAEVWDGNPAALALFQGLGWYEIGFNITCMWVNGKATIEQSPGGVGEKEFIALFDATRWLRHCAVYITIYGGFHVSIEQYTYSSRIIHIH